MYDEFFRDVSALGGALFSLLIFLILLMNSVHLALLFVIGELILMGIVIGIRLIYFKNRPRKQQYTNFIEKVDASSFPSLHAARALFVTFFLATAFSLGIVEVGLMMAGAVMVGYSRIYLPNHDLIDVACGWFFGALVGVILKFTLF